MQKTLVAIIAAGAVGAAWADASVQQQYQYGDRDQFREQPQARAYLSYSFGGGNQVSKLAAPLHYGLRLDHDSRLRQSSVLPPLFQLDHDNHGETLASANGVPFAAHNLRLNQDDSGSGSSSAASSGGGWSFFDWTLLAVGVAGGGYLIYHATEGHDSPDAKKSSSGGSTGSTTSGTTGGLLGGLLGGTTGGSTGGTTGGSTGGLLGGLLGGLTTSGSTGGLAQVQADSEAERDFANQRWLDGGTGQMGDLGGR